MRETKFASIKARFRWPRPARLPGPVRGLPAQGDVTLLDAAHIVGDLEARGEPTVDNGLSLCSIHHRAFDHDLVGVDPDYTVRISPRLLDEEDGPMLDLLKGFHEQPISVPRSAALRPDRERLAERFDRFLARA